MISISIDQSFVVFEHKPNNSMIELTIFYNDWHIENKTQVIETIEKST